MTKINIWLLSVSAIAVAACSSVPITDAELPGPSATTDLPEKWAAQESPSSEYGFVQEGWLDRLAMPELSRFVSRVLENNPDYRRAARQMEAAEFDLGVARADLLPQLRASFAATRQHTSSPSVTRNALDVGLDASWELDVWGRLTAQKAAAASDYAVARYDLEGARLSLAAQVAQSWFAALEAEQQYELAQRTVESFERSERIVRHRYERGLNTGLDLRLALSNLEAARASLSERRDQLAQARRTLELLAGAYPAAAIRAVGQIPEDLPEVPAGLPADLLERRPDLQAAKHRLYAVGYRAQQANKALLPSFSLTASGSNTSDNFSDLLKFDDVFWNLVGNITQPLFQGGRLHYGAKAQEARFEAQKEQFAATLLQAFREVEDALSADRALAEQVRHTARAAENAIAAEQVALDQYSRGLIRITTLLDSQRQSLAQQSQLLLVKRQRINNRIRLHLALGGDFIISEDHQAQNVAEEGSPRETALQKTAYQNEEEE
tara:strand:- start:10388 stop:11872 length:1485 start_codon:yes stop_codon:yes gene_type:complete